MNHQADKLVSSKLETVCTIFGFESNANEYDELKVIKGLKSRNPTEVPDDGTGEMFQFTNEVELTLILNDQEQKIHLDAVDSLFEVLCNWSSYYFFKGATLYTRDEVQKILDHPDTPEVDVECIVDLLRSDESLVKGRHGKWYGASRAILL